MAPCVKRPVRPGRGLSGTRYLIPECCCTASSPCSPASSRTPTGTGSTGRQQSPMPGSSRLPHPGRAPRRRTPVRPASGVSAGSCAPTLPSRWQRTSWRGRRKGRKCGRRISVLPAEGEPDSEARAEFLLLLRRFACELHLRRAPEVSAVYSVDVKAPRDQRVPQGPKERKQSKPARPGPMLKSGTSVPNKTGLHSFQTLIVEMFDTAIHTGSILYRFSKKPSYLTFFINTNLVMQLSHLPPRRLNGKALEKCLGHDKEIHPHTNDSSMGAERTPRQEASTAEESSAVCMFIQPERREGWREWWKANNERWRGRGGRQRWSRELMRRQRKGNTQRWTWWKDGKMVSKLNE